ncbi:MAG: T9SS type A sorting domain-containing protein, partial [bacterium]
VEFDVTSAVNGDGTYSFGLVNGSTNLAEYSSKEGANPPELVIEMGPQLSKEVPEVSEDTDDLDLAQTPPLPEKITLSPNYPNPFNAETNIEYALPGDSKVKLVVYNLRGQLVRTLVDGYEEAGNKKVKWEGRDNDGVEVGSGVYIMQLEVGHQKFSRRIILQK